MRLLVAINPAARAGRGGDVRMRIRQAFRRRGLSPEFLETGPPGSVHPLAAAPLRGVDAVVAAGGDGSLHAAVNGLLERPESERPPLGLLPLGTGNAFARELGLSGEALDAAVDIIAGGRVRAVDLGRVESSAGTDHFINVLGLGFVVRALHAAERVKWLGGAAYTAGTLAAIAGMGGIHLALDADGESIDQDVLLAAVCNSRYTGVNFKLAPDARLDDGALDLVLVHPLSRSRLLRLFPTIYRGAHVEQGEVSVRRVRRMALSVATPSGFALDGELVDATPTRVECVPAAVEMLWPRA